MITEVNISDVVVPKKIRKHLVGSTFLATRPLLELLGKDNTIEELETYRVYLILYSLYHKKYIHNYKSRLDFLQEKTGTSRRGLLKSISLMLKDNKYAYIDEKDKTTLCLFSKSKIFYNTKLLVKGTKQEEEKKAANKFKNQNEIKRKSYLEFSGKQLKDSKYFIAVILKLLTDKKKYKALKEFYDFKEPRKEDSPLSNRLINTYFLKHRSLLRNSLAEGKIQLCLSLKEIAAHLKINISTASRLVTALHSKQLLLKSHNYKQISQCKLKDVSNYEGSHKFKTINNRTYEQLINVIDFNFDLPSRKNLLVKQAEKLIQENLKENLRLVNLPIDYYCNFYNNYQFIDIETGEDLGYINFNSKATKTSAYFENYYESFNKESLVKKQVKIIYTKKNLSWKDSIETIQEYKSKNGYLFYNKIQRLLLKEERNHITNSIYKFEECLDNVSLINKYFLRYFKNTSYIIFLDIFKELNLSNITPTSYKRLRNLLLEMAVIKDDKRRIFMNDKKIILRRKNLQRVSQFNNEGLSFNYYKAINSKDTFSNTISLINNKKVVERNIINKEFLVEAF